MNQTAATEYREVVASEIRAAMGRRRVTRSTLARQVGIGRAALADRLNCRRPFDIDQLIMIGAVLDLDLFAILAASETASGSAA